MNVSGWRAAQTLLFFVSSPPGTEIGAVVNANNTNQITYITKETP